MILAKCQPETRLYSSFQERSWPPTFVTVTKHTGHTKLCLLIISETVTTANMSLTNNAAKSVIFIGNYSSILQASTDLSSDRYDFIPVFCTGTVSAMNDVRTITAPSFTKEENQLCL